MGLNRDGSKAYSLNPLETHVRRLIWHQLCFLDIRTCEAQGPKPAIRREDYDTWMPDNCEEDQLTNATSQPRHSEGWTSTLFSLIRFEINEMMRIIWADRRKLESRKITLTQVLTKIENFRKRMLENYDQLLDDHVPIRRYAKLVMRLLMYRLHVMILHPYYANTANPMPQRLRSVLIMSCIMIIELAMQLDINPAFRVWKWYSGAYQQYQAALILSTEMFYHPDHKEAGRIWACLDYVFGLDCNMPTEEKGRQILMEIMGKMGMYMGMRKMRAPTLTASASPAKHAVKPEEAVSRPEDGIGSAARPLVSSNRQAQGQDYSSARNIHPPMKEETGMVSPLPAGPLPPAPFHTRGPGTPQQRQQQQQVVSGAGPRIVSGPSMMMAGLSTAEGLWGLPPPPLANPDSPENSSSDGGSVVGVGFRQPGMPNSMPPGGGGLANAAGTVLDGDWVSPVSSTSLSLCRFLTHIHGQSNYHEDAINALFPYDAQTGSFAGFGDPVTAGMSNIGSWAHQPQSRPL